ncbi:uncharacterized protein DC041_0005345 [Schistosoma bovis]|uniref:Histone deacetylase domain-containing protein n=1 Tax=Schistosoma bovis TaxID=6184 RepID=A0A430Q4B3_SCHBO|nr:uncharacterized protein DC041_0005345 [Schistosoma bovis]
MKPFWKNNSYTWLCATLAAGSVKHLTELIITNQLSNGLALIRPPGHHAMRSEACGYCIFNNIAITAAKFLQPSDVNTVTKKSINKHNLTYLQPNYDFIGENLGKGYNVNIPLEEVISSFML